MIRIPIHHRRRFIPLSHSLRGKPFQDQRPSLHLSSSRKHPTLPHLPTSCKQISTSPPPPQFVHFSFDRNPYIYIISVIHYTSMLPRKPFQNLAHHPLSNPFPTFRTILNLFPAPFPPSQPLFVNQTQVRSAPSPTGMLPTPKPHFAKQTQLSPSRHFLKQTQ